MGRSTLISIFLFFNFMISYRVLLVSPIPEVELAVELVYIAVLLGYLVYRIVNRVVAGNLSFNTLELYLFVLMLLPVQAALASYFGFGQPIIYGIGTYRDFYMIIGPLAIYNMLRSKLVTIDQVERMFVLTAWTCLALFYGMSLFTNPDKYLEGAAAGSNTAKGGDSYYRFNMAFVFFGTFYYFIKAIYRSKKIYFVYGFIFLIYVVALRFDRTSMAALGGGLFVMFFTSLTLKRQALIFLSAVTPTIILGYGGFLLFPHVYLQYYDMFLDALATLPGSFVAKGQESVRLDELRIALENIKERPFFGNGKISGRWVEGGYNHFFGFFYASDVGIFGQVFMYGFVGAFVLYFQFIFAVIYSTKIKHIKRNVFLVALKYFLVALALDSITNGYLTIYAAQSVTAVVLIYYYYQRDRILGVELKMDKALEETANLERRKKNLIA